MKLDLIVGDLVIWIGGSFLIAFALTAAVNLVYKMSGKDFTHHKAMLIWTWASLVAVSLVYAVIQTNPPSWTNSPEEIVGYVIGCLAVSFVFGLVPALFVYWGVVYIAGKDISGRRCVLIGWGIGLVVLLIGSLYRQPSP